MPRISLPASLFVAVRRPASFPMMAALVGQSTSAPAAENYIGYWRVGYDSLSTGWPGAPTSAYFGGSVAHVSVYQVPLPADEVLRQFQAVG
jgi:hypothetical protein